MTDNDRVFWLASFPDSEIVVIYIDWQRVDRDPTYQPRLGGCFYRQRETAGRTCAGRT